ncbi:MAG: hypothetical protein L6R41_001809 [Letrouitia leprolyta]|nr:MAG: hypothetical protein L6R41_001809 [Letrouitia leprolyta]
MAGEDDTEYFIPLQDQQVFGAGIKRQGIKFVSSVNDDLDRQSPLRVQTQGAGDRYLAIVLNKTRPKEDGSEKPPAEIFRAEKDSVLEEHKTNTICEICKLPVATSHDGVEFAEPSSHETSLAHQTCLEHSHPPSHLDRNRPGLRYLSSYGWDPDSRQGLGATGTGIRMPIKTRPKNDTLGLGFPAPLTANKVTKQPLKKLDAKQTRKSEAEAQKERQRLRDAFYQHEDVERYLGP